MYMKKPSLKIIKDFSKILGSRKTYLNEEFFGWLSSAIECIQYNQMVIYDLLPERENAKKIEPLTLDIDICNNCKDKDFKSSMKCEFECHWPKITVSPNSTGGTQYITPQTIIESIKN